MKIKPILPFMLLLAATSSSEIIANSDLLTEASKHHDLRPDQKKIVQGDKLFIKKHGLVCDKLKVGNLFVGGQLSFNNEGCRPLLAKGTKEKNLLNLRSTFCFDCDSELSCLLNNDCSITGQPAVGCLSLSSSLLNGRLKLCSGAGIGVDKATVCISGTGCQSQFSVPASNRLSVSLTTNIQIEVLIPLFFCLPFCDRPTLQATYDDNSCELNKSICVTAEPIDEEVSLECFVEGHSVTTFLSTSVDPRNITRSTVFLAFTLRYQNCIGMTFRSGTLGCSVTPTEALESVACKEQKKAVVEICKHANTLLKDACFDVNAEGRIL